MRRWLWGWMWRVSESGEDAPAVALGRGYKLLLLRRFRGLDTMTSVGIIAQMIGEFNPAQVFVDETGIGADIADSLRQLEFSYVTGVAFSGSSGKRKYFNKSINVWRCGEIWESGLKMRTFLTIAN
ncbi:MAG: hypothetical protein LBD73_08825 [Deferribacteraceae bacterium]|nr:hypothetical protein [Deferribacteraceae bacterium]